MGDRRRPGFAEIALAGFEWALVIPGYGFPTAFRLKLPKRCSQRPTAWGEAVGCLDGAHESWMRRPPSTPGASPSTRRRSRRRTTGGTERRHRARKRAKSIGRGSEEQSSNTRHVFHFRSSSDPITNSSPRRGRGDLWLYGCLRSDAELVPAPDEARPKSK